MKKFEIVIRGANEEAVAHAVMVGVYGEIQIPEFLNRR